MGHRTLGQSAELCADALKVKEGTALFLRPLFKTSSQDF